MQLVEIHLADLVDVFAGNGEQQPGRAEPGAVAIGAGKLDHHLVQPGLDTGTRLAALAVSAVIPLDAPRNPVEAHLLPFPIVALHFRIGRRHGRDFLLDAVEDGVARRLRQALPRLFERETQSLCEAVHYSAVPGVGIVLERLAHEAAADDAPLRVRNEQLRVRELVYPKPAAGPAGALRKVEDEVFRPDVSVNDAMRRAERGAVKPFSLRLARPLHDVDLHQPVAYQQRSGHP